MDIIILALKDDIAEVLPILLELLELFLQLKSNLRVRHDLLCSFSAHSFCN